MKKLLITLMALMLLSAILSGCAQKQPTTSPGTQDADVEEISQDIQEIENTLDSELDELEALSNELQELESMDLG